VTITDEQIELLRRAIRAEILSHPNPRLNELPLPTDLPAEHIVLANILNGELKPSVFKCTGKDFFGKLEEAAFEFASAMEKHGIPFERWLGAIAAAVRDQGFTGDKIEQTLIDWRDLEASIPTWEVQSHGDRIHELARSRGIINVLTRVESELRVGAVGPDEAIEFLRARLVELEK
jgi:hypothetical protein